MNCPACGTAMTEIAAGDVKVQACKGGCGGLWFDEWTLGKVDQPDQSAGESLLNIPQNASLKVDQSERRKCPRAIFGALNATWSWTSARNVKGSSSIQVN